MDIGRLLITEEDEKSSPDTSQVNIEQFHWNTLKSFYFTDFGLKRICWNK